MKGKEVEMLCAGKIGVMPTDTIYGIVGAAFNEDTVKKVYSLRRRDPKKPMVVLIAAPEEVRRFGVRFDARTKKILKKVWPGKVSVILSCRSRKFSYLHRGTRTLAFRMPKPARLRALLKKTGPLVAPSANFEGEPPAKTARQAKKYFGSRVAFYLDAGPRTGKPSTLVQIKKGKLRVLREGALKIR